jgi:hypothetical protein
MLCVNCGVILLSVSPGSYIQILRRLIFITSEIVHGYLRLNVYHLFNFGLVFVLSHMR